MVRSVNVKKTKSSKKIVLKITMSMTVARADRWEEEVILLREEMRRVVEFLEWQSRDWFGKVDSRARTVTPVVLAGLSVYVNKQGSIFHNLAVRFSQHWRAALVSLSLPHNWATKFLETHKEPLNNPDFKKRNRAKDPPAVRPPSHFSAPDHSRR